MKKILTILPLTIACSSLTAQKHATFYKNNENQIHEIYYLKDTLENILEGQYTSFYMNGAVEKRGNYEEGLPEGIWEYFYENGKPKMKGELEAGDPNGYWVYYFENGNKKMEGKMVGDRREGDWLIYYQNGTIKRKGAFVNGMRKGLWYYYYEDNIVKGKVDFFENKGKYTEYYRSGNIKAKGLKYGTRNTGKWVYYFQNGVKLAEGNYQNGRKQGVWTYYHSNEQISSVGEYEKGKASGGWQYYYSGGELQSSGVFDEGKKQGEWSLFTEKGKLKGKGNFDQGSGTYTEYYSNGGIKVKGFMSNGINQGKWLYYYPDGAIAGECGFINGKGKYSGYYKDGTLKIRGEIANDKKIGTWELYNKSGELSGYYKPYYEKDSPPELIAIGPVIRRNYGVADYKFKSRKFKYFEGKVNEFTGIVVAGNPVQSLLGSVPVSAEFYMQERLGHEFEFILIRNPFFKRDFRVPIDDLYKRGYTIALKQKFYNPDDQFGMWYFGHALYFTNMTHFANIEDSNTSAIVFTTSSEEKKYEYGAILGYRLKVKPTESGFTVDAYLGMAVGYRNFDLSEIRAEAFDFIDQTAFSHTFRAGLNIGYIFAAGKTGRK